NRAFAGLIDLVRRQLEDFHLVWDWTPLRELLAESKVSALSGRRESLKKLIDAVARDNKAGILAGLEGVRDVFTTRATGQGGPAEKWAGIPGGHRPADQADAPHFPGGMTMRRTLLWLALLLNGLTPVPAAAQAPGLELRGVVFSVEDGQADRK